MATYRIEADQLLKLFLSGAAALEANKTWINDLNVFPVPDGDTGTNMTMTVTTAVKELKKLDHPDLEAVAKAIAFGSLRGARGNSGVILSQLLRGFCKVSQEKEYLDAESINEAMKKAVETAYKAVMKPKEGTILTVARGMAEFWAEQVKETANLESLMNATITHGDEVLEKTPELLPVLKEAGVVDSGGQGLIVFLKGAYSCLMGHEVSLDEEQDKKDSFLKNGVIEHEDIIFNEANLGEIVFGYCTEFMIHLDEPFTDESETAFRAFLEGLGDSIVMVADEEICRVHVHTNDPGNAIQEALHYGPLTNLKIENMRFQNDAQKRRNSERRAAAEKVVFTPKKEKTEIPESEWKDYGFIATAAGNGLVEIFKSLGVNEIVEGGQTMNPSTDDMLNAIKRVPAHTIFLMPNNKNIILAAQQAAGLTTDKKVVVIPSTTIPEGISAMLGFSQDQDVRDNECIMRQTMESVQSAEVTYSVRSTTINGMKIRKGDIMGLGGPNGLYAVGKKLEEVTEATVDAMMHEDAAVISLYYGADVAEADAQKLADALTEKYPQCDVELYSGAQPIYYYIISVE
ncbi:MAG: DAK2 domain-containing protein [Lachnospiraceae bacterium]|nr:DAK2 domain-containing protein [Lachnospiraceae bacterium]